MGIYIRNIGIINVYFSKVKVKGKVNHVLN